MKDEDSFDLELEKFNDGKLPASHVFNLGKPGEILQNCGFPAEHRIELAAARLRMKSTQGNHPFNIMDIQGLAEALQEPVAVFEYGDKSKSQNVIVNLEKDGKNFLVGVFFNQKQRGYEVSDIRGLFNRDNMDWIHWIQQGKMIYGNKEKIQVLAEQQRTNLAEVHNKEARTSSDSYYLDSVDNILQSFGDVKDIYTKDYPEYAEQKERFEIFKKFRRAYQKDSVINVFDAVQEADEFYDALKSNNKEVIARYADAFEYPELADAVEAISTVHPVINTNGRSQSDPSYNSDNIVKEKEPVNKEKSQEIQCAEHLMVQGLDSLDSNKKLDQSNYFVNKKEIQENKKFYNGINENIFESISDYLEKGFRPKNDHFIIGKTPLFLQITESNFSEVTIPTSVIKKAVEIHNLSKKEILDSIYKIYNPVLIFDSDKNTTENKVESKLILTDVFKDKKPIALAVNISSDIKLKDSNISVEVQDIRSIHDRTVISKNETDLIKKWTENGLLRYVDDKKIANWSSLARVQFPIEPHQLAENNILTKTELVNKTTPTLVIDSNQAARIKAAREIKENMPNLSEKERAAAIAILEAGAKSQGMEFSEYVEKTFPDGIFGDIKKAENAAKQQGVKINGAVSVNGFGENVRAVIYAGKTADFSTWCHELSHIWQAQLTGELKQNAEEAFQVKDSDWQNSIYTFQDGHTDTSAEAFAYGFEDFLKNKAGEMATEDKKEIFEKFADYMSRTYNGVKQHIEINEKIASVYQKFVELDDNILAQAEKAVQMEKNAKLGIPEAERQREVVKKLYQDTDKWLKAPNGNPTKLTEEQWIAVRTPNFKRWFGNWEFNENKIVKTVELNDSEVEFNHNNASEVEKWLKENLSGKSIIIDSSGAKVLIFNKGLKDSLKRHGEVQRNSYAVLEDLISKSELFDFIKSDGKSKHNGLLGQDVYYSALKVGENYYSVQFKFDVSEKYRTDSYKDHKIMEIKTAPLLYHGSKDVHAITSAVHNFTISQLTNGVKPNFSKMIDENGEPLVVYHGSPNKGFDVFDKNKIGSTTDYGIYGKGFYFSNKKNQAKIYGDTVDVFLNIRKPLILTDYHSTEQIADELDAYPEYFSIQNERVKPTGSFAKQGFVSYLEAKDYDGVIVKQTESTNEIVSFYANQIKSSIDNNGNFDINNDSILFQTAYHGSGANFDKFNTSEYGMTGEGYMAFGYGTYVTDSESIAKDYASAHGKREAGKRNFYTVEIPDGDYLKWEKKVGARTIKKVATELENLGIKNISFIRKDFRDWPLAAQLNYIIHNESMTNKGSGKDLYITVGSILHSPADKETSKFFKDIGFSGIEYPAGTFFGERLNAVNYVIFNDEDIKIKEHFQFQIIGENGALKLDQSEKNNFRIENLKIAQEMAAKGKDEKSIRFATGWEKGVDNKWRYEIDDSKYSFDLINKTKNFERNNPRYVELVKKSLNQYNGGEDLSDQEWDELDKFSDIVWNEYYEAKQVWLTDVLDAPELYEAYPQLKDATVVFDNNPYSPELGSYTKIKYLDSNKTGALIKLNKQPGETDEERYNATMLHEIQHIIQDIEGFAYGGNLEQFVEDDKEIAFEKYSSLAGEVESRNVENRMNMTQEERKNILLSATEDIPRNNQIIQFPKQKEDIIMENTENLESQEYWKNQFHQENAETFKAIDDYLDKGIRPKNNEFIFKNVPEILKSANVSENETIDNGIESIQVNGGMSEAAMEAEILAQENAQHEIEGYNDGQFPLQVVAQSDFNYFNSDKISFTEYIVRTDASVVQDLIEKNTDSFNKSNTKLEENAIPCIIVRKSVNPEIPEQFLLSKYENNNLNKDEIVEQTGKFASKEIKIEDTELITQIKNVIEWNNKQNKTQVNIPELKIYHTLKEDDVRNLEVISDQEFSAIVDSIILNDYKNIPNAIRLPNLNEQLSEKLGLEKDSAFILKKNATHIRPDRKGGYNQALGTEEYYSIPKVIREADFVVVDKRTKNFQIVFDDNDDIKKINKLVFNKDELGNYLVTVGKVDRRDSISEENNTVVAVGVAPTIQTLRTSASSTALRASTTTVDESIAQSKENASSVSENYTKVAVGVAPTISALRHPEELPATRLRPSTTLATEETISQVTQKSMNEEITKLKILEQEDKEQQKKGEKSLQSKKDYTPELKTHSELNAEKIKNLEVITQEEFEKIVDALYQDGKPDYKSIPEIIRIPGLNDELAGKLNIDNENFFLKTNVAHARPQRKGGYAQSLRKEEMRGMLDFISSCQTAYIDTDVRHQNFFLAGLDEKDNKKANKIVFNKDELGNYIVTIGKVETADFNSKNYTKVAVGVEPTIWRAQNEHPIATMLRSSTTLATEETISQVTQKSMNEEITKLQIIEQEDKEQLEAIVMTAREAIKDSLALKAEPIVEIDFTKANYDKLFPRAIVQTPLETVKLGENQFEKLELKDRKRFLLATFQTLATPDLVIDEEREGKHSHNYIKSFVFDEKTKTVQDVVVNIDGKNISITAHPRDINNAVNKIKMPDQLIYAAAEVGQVIEQRTQEAQSIVNPTRADRLSTISVPLNTEYNKENALSIISEFQTFKGQKTEPEFMKKLDNMRDILRTRVEDEGNIISAENNENKNDKQKITTKTDIIKKGAEDFKKAIEEGIVPFLSNEKDDFGVISLRPALIVNASNGLPFSGESQLLAQIYHHQQKMESEIVTSFAGAKDAGTKVVKNNESKKSFALTDTKKLDKKIALLQTRYFTPEACEEPDKLYAYVLQKQRPEKINSYRDLIQHFEKIPNGQKEISDLRIKIAHEHLKEIQSRFAIKEERTFTVDEIKERKIILQNYFSNLPEKYRSEEKSAFENTFGIVLNPEEDLKINLEGKFESAKQFQEAVKSSEKTINIENQKLSSFIQKNSMQNEKLSHIFHEEYKKQKEEDRETSENLKIEAKGISEPETYLGKYLAACSSNAEFVTDPATVETVRKNLVNKLEKNYRIEKYEILKEIGQQAQQIALETTQQMAFNKAHSNNKKQDKNLSQEIGPVGMGR